MEPLRLTYETTTSDTQASLDKVLLSLQVNPESARNTPEVIAKMGDNTTRDWIERYREDSK
ncbi:Stf0 family sulfotransferase [Phyllobacterium sp. K27]